MRTMKKPNLPLRLQKGFMLLETALALLIVSAVGTIALNSQLADLKDQKAIAQAHSLLQVQGGANSYITSFRSQLAAGSPIPGVSLIYDPTIAELNGLNVGLPPNFSSAAMIGGTYRVHVATTPSPCTPTSCQISAITWVTQPLNENDGSVDYPRLGLAMRALGADGAVSSNIDAATGAVNNAAASSIRGANNAWNMTNPAGAVPGIMAARAGFDSQIFNQFVRRDGQSQMTGNLQLGDGTNNNSITNLKNVTADGVVSGSGAVSSSRIVCAGNSSPDCNGSGGSSMTNSMITADNTNFQWLYSNWGSVSTMNSSTTNSNTVNAFRVNSTAGLTLGNGNPSYAAEIKSLNPLNIESTGSGVFMNYTSGAPLTVGSPTSPSQTFHNGDSYHTGNTTNTGYTNTYGNVFGNSDNWSFIGSDSGGISNANAKDRAGSMVVNDVYVRSVGKWASDIANAGSPSGSLCGAAHYDAGMGGVYVNHADCEGQAIMSGCPTNYSLIVTGAAYSNWFYSCAKN